MEELNPRLRAFREDLADERLRGIVDAPRYVAGETAVLRDSVTDLRRAPREDAPLDSQLLLGESVKVFDSGGVWSWVQSDVDGYVGYLPTQSLTYEAPAPTHRVAVPRTFLFARPHIKSQVLAHLSLGSRVACKEARGSFLLTEDPRGGGDAWLYRPHLRGLEEFASDHVACARRFLETPYLWGGRSGFGLDCSALIQLALGECGQKVLRDSSMQETSIGASRPLDATPCYGDLIYFPGHVAIAISAEEVLHANAHTLSVALEPLDRLVARVIAESGGTGITAIRRI
jgi:cell wall-associated NlpC family hydrolase